MELVIKIIAIVTVWSILWLLAPIPYMSNIENTAHGYWYSGDMRERQLGVRVTQLATEVEQNGLIDRTQCSLTPTSWHLHSVASGARYSLTNFHRDIV